MFLSMYVVIMGWKTWMLHDSCLQSVALGGAALYLGRVFTTKGLFNRINNAN
jgi:hypothetical protein